MLPWNAATMFAFIGLGCRRGIHVSQTCLVFCKKKWHAEKLSLSLHNTDDTVTLTFDLLLKKVNLGHNFWIKGEKALILHMLVPLYDKTFLFLPKILTL